MIPHKPPLNKEILKRCRESRQEPTAAEERLWAFLKNRQLCGLKFRRQHPLEGYVLDFYCKEANLCVELDGSGHLDPDQEKYDQERTHSLQALGIRVIRFWNNDVFTHIDIVLDEIVKAATPSS